MLKTRTIVEAGDLLECAEKIGIPWNKAHKILFDCGENKDVDLLRFTNCTIYLEEIRDGVYGDISPEAFKILDIFIKENPTKFEYFLAGKIS